MVSNKERELCIAHSSGTLSGAATMDYVLCSHLYLTMPPPQTLLPSCLQNNTQNMKCVFSIGRTQISHTHSCTRINQIHYIQSGGVLQHSVLVPDGGISDGRWRESGWWLVGTTHSQEI